MTTSTQLFQTLPKKFQELLKHISEDHLLEIEPIEKLSGGKSGAALFYVSVWKADFPTKRHCILKLDHVTKWENEANEVQRHTDALELSSPQFATKHLPQFAYDPIEFQGTIAIFYTIAGNSLQHCRPIGSYSKQKELEGIFKTVGYDLLAEWQKKVVFELTAPQKILEKWLGYRITAEGNIESFLTNFCHISNGNQAILYGNNRLPNPLYFAQNLSAWGNVRHLQAAKGLVHGDLHTQNILAEMLTTGEFSEYFFIDFANFKSDEFLFYDHLYLELSYLLKQRDYNSPEDWSELITALSENNLPDIQNVSAKLSGVCALVNVSRTSLKQWIDTFHHDKPDDLWGQFRLAAIAVGLNFSNKPGLSEEKRFAAFIYAALNLKTFCKQFNISIQGSAEEISLHKPEENVEMPNDWDGFFDACHEFSNDRLHILITGPQKQTDVSALSYFGLIPLALVFDFDKAMDVDGFYKSVVKELGKRRAVHLLTLRDNYTLNPKRAVYWYAANGLAGRADTITDEKDFRLWNRKYSQSLQKFLADFNSADESPVTVVVVWDEIEFVEEIVKLIDLTIGDKAEYVFAVTSKEKLKRVEDRYKAKSFQLNTRQIGFGIKKFFNPAVTPSGKVYLPTNSDLPVELPPDVVTSLEEEMTLVHLDCGIFAEEGRVVGRDFLRGKKISWFELGMHFDVERSSKSIVDLENQVKSDLEKREFTRINLYHFPGAGGSTVALRIAWNLHKNFPTVLLHKITSETKLKLIRVNRETGKAMLVIVESAEVQLEILNKLYSELQSETLPIVFLIITRRFEFPQNSVTRSFYLPEKLELEEANRFAQIYGQNEPRNLQKLQNLASQPNQINQRTPFYFGLTAFEDEFVMIEPYVAHYLENLRDEEKTILCYLSIAYKYAQQPLPPQIFANVLRTPFSRNVKLDKALSKERFKLLVLDDQQWRPAHFLIAEEIVKQILSANTIRENWKQSLSNWSNRLIEDLSSFNSTETEKMNLFATDFSKRLFVLRGSEDVLDETSEKSKFARLITDIPSQEGRLAVFEKLVQAFPYEPHFHAHYARFLNTLGDYPKALGEAEKAISLEYNDDVLHHIKGTVIKHRVNFLIKEANRELARGQQITTEAESDLLNLAETAENEFEISRQLAPDKDFGYVSNIQLLIMLIEFGFRKSGKREKTDFLTDPQTLNYQQMVERAEAILDAVKRMRADRKLTDFIENCETDINELYGNYSIVLERWNNILTRQHIFKPPVRRRLVYAYLGKNQRNWDLISRKELKQIHGLMEDNLLEEPNDEKNIKLWFNSARRIDTVSIDSAIEKFAYLYAETKNLDVLYYLYVMQTLKAIDGSEQARINAEKLILEIQQRARYMPNGKYSFDWLGRGAELTRLVHYRRLGEFVEEKNFFENEEPLARITGKIIKANKPEAGYLELKCGLQAFFVPQPSRHRQDAVLIYPDDLNKNVDFYLGFSYEGLRAWSVKFSKVTLR